ncbi:right-handed parallel beta-helix repeat-containing protein [Brevundimonas sp.]|uniref:right-handed parallel beta-helix repeat-containing protein n=1 Tax=Brevundimonas sp. TaxID=1871086 RepID=UPI0028B04D88|nr:right-handed parallel beta-helix repeat-containing protein [Brevundimonas sp.]
MADAVVTVQSNRAVITLGGGEIVGFQAAQAAAPFAERAEEALAQIEQIAAGAPDAPSVLNKLDKTENLSELADVAAARQNLSLNEVSPLEYGAKGDGVADDTAAVLAALASGRTVNLRGLTYTVNSMIELNGRRMVGPGVIAASSTFSANIIVGVRGVDTQMHRVTVDGSARLTGPPYQTVSGVRATGSTTNLLLTECTAQNLTFDGINITQATTFAHEAPKIVSCHSENVGWVGINMEAATGGLIQGNTIRRTGYHGIGISMYCDGVLVQGNHVDKATPPTHVYDGPGSIGGDESGFLIYKEPNCSRIVINGNVFDDNRNAGQDGIGVGEDGTEHGSWVISNNIVRHAGLFGIDPTGNCTCTSNFIDEPTEQGIHVSLDLGGILRNTVVSGNVIRNAGQTAGSYAIQIGDTLGAVITVKNIKISDNIVIDDRATKLTGYGVGVVCDEATYEGLSITGNDFARVATAGIMIFGANGPGADYEAWGNKVLGDERQAWTPTVTPASGSITTSSASGRYQRVGKMVEMRGRCQITTAGTGTGPLTLSLPVAARSGTTLPITCVNGSGAEPLYAVATGSGLVIAKSGGATVIINGADLYFNGTYEAA